jgi:hypothetical protein
VKETLIQAIRDMFENKWEYLELGSSQTDLVESYVIQAINDAWQEPKEDNSLSIALDIMTDRQVDEFVERTERGES